MLVYQCEGCNASWPYNVASLPQSCQSCDRSVDTEISGIDASEETIAAVLKRLRDAAKRIDNLALTVGGLSEHVNNLAAELKAHINRQRALHEQSQSANMSQESQVEDSTLNKEFQLFLGHQLSRWGAARVINYLKWLEEKTEYQKKMVGTRSLGLQGYPGVEIELIKFADTQLSLAREFCGQHTQYLDLMRCFQVHDVKGLTDGQNCHEQRMEKVQSKLHTAKAKLCAAPNVKEKLGRLAAYPNFDELLFQGLLLPKVVDRTWVTYWDFPGSFKLFEMSKAGISS